MIGVGAVSLAMVGLNHAAHAHRARLALTNVVWRADEASSKSAGRIEITHELHAHDALTALSVAAAARSDDDEAEATSRKGETGSGRLALTDLEARARLALMASDKFRLFGADEAVLNIETIGAEVKANHVYIYQEIRLAAPPTRLFIENDLLRDVFADQVNHVNITIHDKTRTLIFDDGKGRQAAAFNDVQKAPEEADETALGDDNKNDSGAKAASVPF